MTNPELPVSSLEDPHTRRKSVHHDETTAREGSHHKTTLVAFQSKRNLPGSLWCKREKENT